MTNLSLRVALALLMGNFVSDADKAARALGGIGDAGDKASVGLEKAEQQSRKTSEKGTGKFKEWTDAAQKNAQSWQTIGTASAMVGGAVLGVYESMLRRGIEYNTLLQTTKASLTTMLGSAEAAQKQLDDLAAFASSSPFARDMFIQAQQGMLAFGIEAQKVIPYLDAIQNAVAAAGGGNNDILELANVMSKVQSSGKITAITLQEFGRRGVDAATLIGDSMGMTGSQIRNAITDGSLDAGAALDALASGMQSKFGGAADGVKQTLEGAIDRVKGAWRDLSSEMARPLVNPDGGGFLVDLANKVADVMRAFQALPEPAKNVLSGVTLVFGGVATAAGTAIPAILKIVPALNAVKAAGGKAALAMNVLKASSIGIGGALAIAVGAAMVFKANADDAKAATNRWAGAMDEAGTIGKDSIKGILDAWGDGRSLGEKLLGNDMAGGIKEWASELGYSIADMAEWASSADSMAEAVKELEARLEKVKEAQRIGTAKSGLDAKVVAKERGALQELINALKGEEASAREAAATTQETEEAIAGLGNATGMTDAQVEAATEAMEEWRKANQKALDSFGDATSVMKDLISQWDDGSDAIKSAYEEAKGDSEKPPSMAAWTKEFKDQAKAADTWAANLATANKQVTKEFSADDPLGEAAGRFVQALADMGTEGAEQLALFVGSNTEARAEIVAAWADANPAPPSVDEWIQYYTDLANLQLEWATTVDDAYQVVRDTLPEHLQSASTDMIDTLKDMGPEGLAVISQFVNGSEADQLRWAEGWAAAASTSSEAIDTLDGSFDATVTVDTDLGPAQMKLGEFVADKSFVEATVTVEGETGPLEQTVSGATAAVDNATGVVTITGDDGEAVATLTHYTAEVDNATGTVTITGNDSEGRTVTTQLRSWVDYQVGTMRVRADTSEAQRKIEQMRQLASATIRIPVTATPGNAAGGSIPGNATGGFLPGPRGPEHEDNILGVDGRGMPTALVQSGEFVTRRRASDYYGSLMWGINNMQIPREALAALLSASRRATGGLVGLAIGGTIPALASGGKTKKTKESATFKSVGSALKSLGYTAKGVEMTEFQHLLYDRSKAIREAKKAHDKNLVAALKKTHKAENATLKNSAKNRNALLGDMGLTSAGSPMSALQKQNHERAKAINEARGAGNKALVAALKKSHAAEDAALKNTSGNRKALLGGMGLNPDGTVMSEIQQRTYDRTQSIKAAEAEGNKALVAALKLKYAAEDKAMAQEYRKARGEAGKALSKEIARGQVAGAVDSLSSAQSLSDRLRSTAVDSSLGLSAKQASNLAKAANDAEKGFTALYKQADAVANKLEAARDTMADLKQISEQAASSISSGWSLSDALQQPDGPSLAEQVAQGKWIANGDGTSQWESSASSAIQSPLAKAQAFAAQVRKFSGKLDELRKKGFAGVILQEIAAMGVEAGITAADVLLGMSTTDVKAMNQAYSDIEKCSNQAGQYVTEGFYKGGLSAADGLVKGLESQEKAIQDAIMKIATSMETALKTALGIKSPSRVFRDLAAWVPKGAALGIMDEIPSVTKAMQAMIEVPEQFTQADLGFGPLGSAYGGPDAGTARRTSVTLDQQQPIKLDNGQLEQLAQRTAQLVGDRYDGATGRLANVVTVHGEQVARGVVNANRRKEQAMSKIGVR
ncbi:MAG: tape measure protein [Cellulomonadaceae bacterium]|jgi:tape measure domain-containing protein|nr:tape measure protein [Cellulomonadaceae bacterium]